MGREAHNFGLLHAISGEEEALVLLHALEAEKGVLRSMQGSQQTTADTRGYGIF